MLRLRGQFPHARIGHVLLTAMRRLLTLTAASLAVLLASCNATQQAKIQGTLATVAGDIKSVASGILAAADAACSDVLPVVKAVSGLVNNAKVTSLVGYAVSVCSPAGTVIPGSNINASTAGWIGGIKTGLTVAANLNVPAQAAAAASVAPAAAPSTPVAVPSPAAPAAAPVTVAVPASAQAAP